MKQGVDDFLVSGRTVEDLLALATPELKPVPGHDENSSPYRDSARGLVWEKPTKEGTVDVPLTNFSAAIVGEVAEDDGAEVSRMFELEAGLGRKKTSFLVSSGQFASMNWPIEKLGAGAIIYPGFNAKEHARAAIQLLSEDVSERQVYAHLGFREIDGRTVYLHAGGAVSPAGQEEQVEVRVGEGLNSYELPEPPTGEALKRAVRASLDLINLTPADVGFSGLAAVYRAPLCHVLPADFSLFVAGTTGAFKSQLTALWQAHFGAAFSGLSLPGNWKSTANALEKLAFIAKDALLTIDDFVLAGTATDVKGLYSKAERLFRAQGNQAGRGRMRADGGLRPSYYPRGVIVASGEDTPKGHSLGARIFFLEVEKSQIDPARLTAAQTKAAEGLFAASMSAYVSWLAPRLGKLRGELSGRRLALRAEAARGLRHRRTPDQVASLAVGFETFLRFALEAGAIGEEERSDLWTRAWRALGEAARRQAQHQASEDPVARFIDLLAAAVASGHAHVADAGTGETPEDPRRWGWRSGDAQNDPRRDEWRSRGELVGWLEGKELLLEPEVAYACAQKLARSQGDDLAMSKTTLYKRLHERGLVTTSDKGRNSTKRSVGGGRRRVVCVSAGFLGAETGASGADGAGDVLDAVPEAVSGPGGGEAGADLGPIGRGAAPTAPAERPAAEPKVEEPGRETTLETAPKTHTAPAAPLAPVRGATDVPVAEQVDALDLEALERLVLQGDYRGVPGVYAGISLGNVGPRLERDLQALKKADGPKRREVLRHLAEFARSHK